MPIIEYDDKKQVFYERCNFCRGRAYYYDQENEHFLCGSSKTNCPSWKFYEDIPNQTCYYCGLQANYYFPTANRYCCTESYHTCPETRKIRRERQLKKYYNSPGVVFKRECEEGKYPCVYCGEPSKHAPNGKACCSSTAKACPGYHDWLSAKKKKMYADNPDMIEKMRQVALDVHNRESVKESKREKMLILHHEDCIPCVEFQQKYKEGYKNRDLSNLRKKVEDVEETSDENTSV